MPKKRTNIGFYPIDDFIFFQKITKKQIFFAIPKNVRIFDD